jgi:hypothetical protein
VLPDSGLQPVFVNKHVARVTCLGASNLCHPKAGIVVDFDLCLFGNKHVARVAYLGTASIFGQVVHLDHSWVDDDALHCIS